MKNKNKFWALFLSLTICSVGFIACSDDDITTEDEVVDEEAVVEEEIIEEEVEEVEEEEPDNPDDGGPGGDGEGRPGGDDDGDDVDIPEDDGETVSELHAAFAEFDESLQIYLSEDNTDYIIEADGRPNHKTAYYPLDNALYEYEDLDYTGNDEDGNGTLDEDEITRIFDDGDYAVTFTIDATPNFSTSIETAINEIGIAVSGGYIYNNLEGPTDLTEMTAESLDYTGGHIGPSNYHYHLEPVAFSEDDSKLIGILLDGVFIYGRKCSSTGDYPTDLDEVGGHTHVTEHSSGEEEYHYHMLNTPFFGEGTDDYLIFEGPYKGF